MAGVWQGEQIESGGGLMKFNEPTSQLRFLITGTLDKNDVIALCIANLPPYNTVATIPQFLRTYKFDPQGDGSVWVITADYGNTPNYWEMQGDTSGGKTKMMTALSTIRSYECTGVAGATAPDFGKLIGVNGQNVQGVDVGLPMFDFAIIYKFKFSTLTSGYLQTLFNTAWHTNATDYQLILKGQILNFGPEELLYMGGPFKQDANDDVEITFKFSASKSKAGGSTLVGLGFTQPSIGANVTIQMATFGDFSDGSIIFIVGGGIYTIVSHTGPVGIDNHFNVVVTNIGGSQNAPPGTIIPAGTLISADQTDQDPVAIGASGPIKKRGWHYLWSSAQPTNDPASNRMIVKPFAAYVQKVYPTADLSVLGIGASAGGSFP